MSELLGVEAPSTPTQWVHNDVLGSPIVRTDDAGTAVASTRYGVFGDVAFREEPGAPQGPRFGFTGHQYDTSTELVYANARYYQPGLGRFLTQDAFLGRPQQPASVHRYLYAAHSPMVFFDPTGFETVCDRSGDCYNDESAFSMYFYDFRQEGRIVGRNIALATDQAGRSIGNNAARYYLSYEEGGVESVYSLAIDDTEGVIAEADERYTAGGGGISGLSEVARPYNPASFLLEGGYDTQRGIVEGDAALARRGIGKVTIGTVGVLGVGASGVGASQTMRAGLRRGGKLRTDADLVTESLSGERALKRVPDPSTPDKGLAGRGVRPEPGTRSLTREQYRALDRAERVRANASPAQGASGQSTALTRGTRAQLRIRAGDWTPRELDQLRAAVAQTNARLATGAGTARVGQGVKFSSRKSRRFVRDQLFPDKAIDDVRVADASQKLGFDVQVDEIVPRFLGGQQVGQNQRFLPQRLNSRLGPIEYNAVKDLPEGTVIQGFDIVFVK